jgi:hypothetical protein
LSLLRTVDIDRKVAEMRKKLLQKNLTFKASKRSTDAVMDATPKRKWFLLSG